LTSPALSDLSMDLYELLGIRRSASLAEIRRAYQKHARQLHPDLNPGDPLAAERFRTVLTAFQVLSNPQRREEYDRGEMRPSPPPSGPEVGFEGFDFSVEGRSADVGFQEIFGQALRPSKKEVAPVRGEDLEQATRITFAESLQGTDRRVHLVRQAPCSICKGAGDVFFGPVPCPRCHGSGRVRASRGHMIFSRRCSECGATGQLDRRPCTRCGGEGRVIHSEWLHVRIPPGVSPSSPLRLEGCGNAGRRGGPPGDFVLVVEIEPHPFYRREGDDLFCEVPVTITEAALGAHVEIPTPEGPVSIEIPAGTQTGQRFRLRKRGVPKLGENERGDLYVQARVVVPAIKDDKSRELLREVARLNPEDPRKDLLTPAPSERA